MKNLQNYFIKLTAAFLRIVLPLNSSLVFATMINEIILESNEGFDVPQALSLFGVKEGDQFDPVIIDQGLSRLALTSDFQKIQSHFDDQTGKIVLVLEVHNRLSRVRINFPYFNAKSVPDHIKEDIIKSIGVYEGEYLSQDMSVEMKSRITEAISRRGFKDFDVVIVLTKETKGSGRVLEVTVTGGQPILVHGFAFKGFDDSQYRDFFSELRDLPSIAPAISGIGIKGFKTGTLKSPMLYDTEALTIAKETFVKDLRNRGYYDLSFQIISEGNDDNRIITFALNKGPQYNIQIQGAKAFWERDLRQKLLERSVRLGLPFSVVEATLRIQRSYKELGYADIAVTSKIEESSGKKKVIFNVNEGKKYFFRKVSFKGARPSELTILEPAVEAWLGPLKNPFHHIYYYPDVILGSLSGFLAILKNHGYLEAAIVDFEFHPEIKNSRFYKLELNVRLGRRFRVRNLSVIGNIALSSEDLEKIVTIDSGDYLNPQKALSIATSLKENYQALGFMSAEVSQTEKDIFQFPLEKGVVDLTYSIIPGPKVRVGRVVVEGTNKTKDQVITRELNDFSLEEGDPMDPIGIREYEQRLLGLGLFSSVDIKPVNGRILERADPATGKIEVQEKDLSVSVRERPGGSIEFGPGYRTDLGAIAFAELNYRNLGGWNRSVFLRSQVSRKLDNRTYQFLEQKYSVVYLEPYLLDWRLSLRTELDYRKRDDIKYLRKQKVAGFNSEEIRGRVSVEREIFKNLFWTQNIYEYSIAKIFDIVTEPSDPQNYYTITSTGFSIRYDKRNNVFNPTSGFALLHSVSLSAPELGGDDNAHFINWRQQYNGYLPLGKGSALALSTVYSRIWALKKSQQIPENKRLVLGGRSSIRSLPERFLRFDQEGVLDQHSINLRIEYRQPIFLDWGAAVFFEGGQVDVLRSRNNDLNTWLSRSTTFRKATGLGFRYATPVGPVALDFGYNMDIRPGENQYRFNLSIGSF